MGKTVITVEDAVKEYGAAKALDGVTLSFEEGKIYGIIGRNGSGKTVLLKCICGLTRLTKGSVRVNGKTVGKEVDFPENIGMIIETPGFLPNYSGYDNLKMLASYQGKIGKQQIKDAIALVGLNPDDKKWVGKYSLGMRQRLGLAQAVMENPEILILDEPMNGLDNSGVKEMRELFLQLKEQGKTILLASHNREDIEILCDEVYEMDHGKIISHQSRQE